MNFVESIVLGVIQGLTEFLPISSSGHLVISQYLFGLKEPHLSFDIAVHLGTLAAVIIYFWQDIRSLVITLLNFPSLYSKYKRGQLTPLEKQDMKLLLLIIIGSIPTGVIGLLFHEISDRLFSSVSLVGVTLLITGSLLWLTAYVKKPGCGILEFSKTKSFLIGIVQGLAILPGISRSGSTIAMGIFLGISKETAAKFSFLLSIPAILGATLLMVKGLSDDPTFSTNTTILGTLTSCIVGYLSLRLLVYIINKGKLHYFAPYCWMMGMVCFLL